MSSWSVENFWVYAYYAYLPIMPICLLCLFAYYAISLVNPTIFAIHSTALINHTILLFLLFILFIFLSEKKIKQREKYKHLDIWKEAQRHHWCIGENIKRSAYFFRLWRYLVNEAGLPNSILLHRTEHVLFSISFGEFNPAAAHVSPYACNVCCPAQNFVYADNRQVRSWCTWAAPGSHTGIQIMYPKL